MVAGQRQLSRREGGRVPGPAQAQAALLALPSRTWCGVVLAERISRSAWQVVAGCEPRKLLLFPQRGDGGHGLVQSRLRCCTTPGCDRKPSGAPRGGSKAGQRYTWAGGLPPQPA